MMTHEGHNIRRLGISTSPLLGIFFGHMSRIFWLVTKKMTRFTKCRFLTTRSIYFLGVEEIFSVSKINQTDWSLVKRRGEEMSTAGTSGQQRCRFGKRYASLVQCPFVTFGNCDLSRVKTTGKFSGYRRDAPVLRLLTHPPPVRPL
jgi:hypothetical protein